MDIAQLRNRDWHLINETLAESAFEIEAVLKDWRAKNPTQKTVSLGRILTNFHYCALIAYEGTIPTQLQRLLRKKFNKNGLAFKHVTTRSGDKVFSLQPKNLDKFVTKVLSVR